MRISVDAARWVAEHFLARYGLPSADAARIADIVVEAELRGRPSHGFLRLPGIARQYRPGGRSFIVNEDGHWSLLDGGGRLGYLVAHEAMQHAIGKAKSLGSSLVGVRNTSHAGMAGYYVEQARKQDLVALLFADTHPRVTAFGGREAVLGTNPLAVAVPSDRTPVLLDMSTASLTNGDLLVALRDGVTLPEGLAVDAAGRPTTDPAEAQAGAVHPFGAHKGFGLALIIQIFAGALVNAATIPEPSRDYGLLLIVIDPAIFSPIGAFKREVQALVDRLREARRDDSCSDIFVPGERADRARARNLRVGLDLDASLLARLGADTSGA